MGNPICSECGKAFMDKKGHGKKYYECPNCRHKELISPHKMMER